MALTTLASVKAQGGIAAGDTSRDLQLRSLFDAVTSLVKQHLNRDLESQQYTEFYSGDGTPFLQLNQYPVTAISLVCIDDAGYFGSAPNGFPSNRSLVEGVDYALTYGSGGHGSTGTLRRIGTTWRRLPSRALGLLQNLPGVPNGNIKVQYTAGFTVIPSALVMAVNASVLRLAIAASVGGGVSQMSYEDAHVGFLAPGESEKLFGSIEDILANYKSIPF